MGWGDEADEPTSPEETEPAAPAGGGGRPRLNLMPRGATAGSAAADGSGGGGGDVSKSNPFGAAKPREEGKNSL